MRSHEGEACAAMLIEYHLTLGFPYEVDLFLAQAVLQLAFILFLCFDLMRFLHINNFLKLFFGIFINI